MRRIEKAADRFLTLLVPRVTAKADPCSCSGHWSYCTDQCGRYGCTVYRWLYFCNGCQIDRVCDGCPRVIC